MTGRYTRGSSIAGVSQQPISPVRMYTCVKEETNGVRSANLVGVHPNPRLHRLLVIGAALVVAAGAVAAVVTLNGSRTALEAEQTRPLAIGDCVVVASSDAVAQSAPNSVATRRSSCAADPSYTVGAMSGPTGTCPSSEYQHFAGPTADQATSSLCLVPNLVADHCYRLSMPIGLVEKAECTDTRSDPASGVLVQVTQRLDERDQHACPSTSGHYAWPYPSPARTYCTATVY